MHLTACVLTLNFYFHISHMQRKETQQGNKQRQSLVRDEERNSHYRTCQCTALLPESSYKASPADLEMKHVINLCIRITPAHTLSLRDFAYKTHLILWQDETNIFAPVMIMSLFNPTHHL